MQDQILGATVTGALDAACSVTVEAPNRDREFCERVAEVVSDSGGPLALARSCGLSERVIRKWAAGESDPSRENLLKLAKGGNVCLLWLATGEGLKRGKTGAEGADHDQLTVPRYRLRFGAGPGRIAVDEEPASEISFSREMLRRKGLKPEHCALGEVAGSSMERDLFNGDLFLFDRSDCNVRSGCIYAIRLGDELIVKYVQRAPGGGVILISANPAVAQPMVIPPTISAEEFEILGAVHISSRFWT